MKRLIGGLVLLNFTAISLNLSAGETDITDAGVLEQLTQLRGFIDEKRDFTKDAKDLKPVLVQYRSSASKVDGIVECNLSFNTDALHLSIGGYSVQADGTPITIVINVVYEWTEYIGYTIKSAKINATKSFAVDYLNATIPFENIKDRDNHDRFVEGDGVPADDTNINVTYCKWSLSGSHLMLVLAGSIADETTVPAGTYAQFNLPKWIRDKIYPVFASTRIEIKDVPLFGDDWSTEEHYPFKIALTKNSDGLAFININYPATTTQARFFRVQFDLLIDNEPPAQESNE